MTGKSSYAPRATHLTKRATLLCAAGVFAYLSLLAGATSLEACGGGSDTTGGKRVTLHTVVTIDPAATQAFDTGIGWHLELTRIVLAMGPFYYFDGAPPLVRFAPVRDERWAVRLLGVEPAFAHPGHYQAGNAMGEMLESTSVDLLAGPATLPDGDGISGTYRSARFTFPPTATGPFAIELGDHVALVEGKAQKDGENARTFRATGDYGEIAKSEANAQIEGCELVETDVESDGTITLTVNPRVWFNIVDFSQVAEGSTEAPATFDAGSQPAIAFTQGLAQLSAYHFVFSTP